MARSLDWFEVSGREQFLVGTKLDVTGVGSGYWDAIAIASDVVAFPHVEVSRDRLTAACNELADLLTQIVAEDGNSQSVSACLRAVLIQHARDLAVAKERASA